MSDRIPPVPPAGEAEMRQHLGVWGVSPSGVQRQRLWRSLRRRGVPRGSAPWRCLRRASRKKRRAEIALGGVGQDCDHRFARAELLCQPERRRYIGAA